MEKEQLKLHHYFYMTKKNILYFIRGWQGLKGRHSLYLDEALARALTRKLQLGQSDPNWESERSKHARISAPKCSWEVWGTL